MRQEDIENRQLVLINYIQSIVNNFTNEKWKIKAEYSTNDNDKRVIIVQEQSGNKQVFYGDVKPIYNYYLIDIFGLSIQECKDLSLMLGDLIGTNKVVEYNKEKWQIMFIQQSNPQAIEYEDLRRIGYSMNLQTIINKI